ncbi:MAG: iron-sulfur cluster-binding domain-containing protein [Actinobacteria bacterium]|nr:iron-sulfur cluster-binding domain-containing protein [Actinomycetota bacterium]
MTIIDRPLVHRLLTSPLVGTLTAPHGVDRYLELVDPGMAVHDVRGRVLHIERQTPTTATITVGVNRAWSGHRAGQFVRVGATVDGVTHTRCYSIESTPTGPGPTTIAFSVGEVPGGTLSPHLVHELRPGDVLRLSPAEGDFVLPDEATPNLVLLGAGTGITPLIAMVRTLCATGRLARTDATLVAYAATPEDQLHRNELIHLAAETPGLRVVFGCTEQAGAGDLDGLFTPDHLGTAAPQWRDAELFVCGGRPFMSAVSAAVEAEGRLDHLHTEAFAPAFIAFPTDPADNGTVEFHSSRRRATDVATSILEAAEAQGLQPAHGCRMGICHTCTRTKLAGCVRNLVTGEVSGPEAAEIQICVNAPVGDVVIDL